MDYYDFIPTFTFVSDFEGEVQGIDMGEVSYSDSSVYLRLRNWYQKVGGEMVGVIDIGGRQIGWASVIT